MKKLKKFSKNCTKSKPRLKILIGIMLGLLFIYFRTPYFLVMVNGDSMNPTLQSYSILSFVKDVRDIRKDDIVVFKHRGEIYIKRVVGIEGEIYTEQVAEPIDYSMGNNIPRKNSQYYRLLVVPKNYVFVQGDNPLYSVDSKVYGPIPKSEIFGKWIGSVKQ